MNDGLLGRNDMQFRASICKAAGSSKVLVLAHHNTLYRISEKFHDFLISPT